MREHPHHPLVVEESAYVGVQYPAHPLRHDGPVHRAQRLVGAATGPETVGAVQEIGLVDGTEHLGHRTLDNLVFQGQDSERALPPVGLRDVDSPHWLRTISTAVQPVAQVSQATLQVLRIVLNRHRIYPGRRRST